MRYRWDPAYPMARRYGYGMSEDTTLRASDAERNEVADKLSRHFAEGRLDQSEFKARLDTAMSATTRGDLKGLFHDLPALSVEPVGPPPRRRRFVPLWAMVALFIVAVSVTASTWPFVHIPWFLVFVVAFFFWHRSGGRRHRHPHRHEMEH
jgi:hypothetical protein